jgi:hypothetical protein
MVDRTTVTVKANRCGTTNDLKLPPGILYMRKKPAKQDSIFNGSEAIPAATSWYSLALLLWSSNT